MASENLETVRRFCDAFSRRDPDEILDFFTDDAVYHNMPMPPVQGKAGIKTVLDMFLKPAQSVEFIILKIAEADGGAVLTERLDKFALGGKNIELPVNLGRGQRPLAQCASSGDHAAMTSTP